MGDALVFRQQLSRTSFETFELEIAVNHPNLHIERGMLISREIS